MKIKNPTLLVGKVVYYEWTNHLGKKKRRYCRVTEVVKEAAGFRRWLVWGNWTDYKKYIDTRKDLGWMPLSGITPIKEA